MLQANRKAGKGLTTVNRVGKRGKKKKVGERAIVAGGWDRWLSEAQSMPARAIVDVVQERRLGRAGSLSPSACLVCV